MLEHEAWCRDRELHDRPGGVPPSDSRPDDERQREAVAQDLLLQALTLHSDAEVVAGCHALTADPLVPPATTSGRTTLDDFYPENATASEVTPPLPLPRFSPSFVVSLASLALLDERQLLSAPPSIMFAKLAKTATQNHPTFLFFGCCSNPFQLVGLPCLTVH